MKDEKNGGKFKWDEIVFGAIEKIATAQSKFKDPKESVSQAFEWVKTIRDDIQEKITQEISEKLKYLDMESVAKKVGEHLADHYDIEVVSKISLKPKDRKKQNAPKAEKSTEKKSDSQKTDRS
ncbi:MAG: hypothetical protein JWQ35_3 [Bacteriovoracaceae bacterium]|nr:hypothetical protein [Bacteriovoracaceae bacterium]